MKEDKNQEAWKRFLDPESLKTNLILVSLYIVAFEILQDIIIERPREFFSNGFGEEELRRDKKKYTGHVLSKNKSPAYASLYWFKEMDGINDEDIISYGKIKDCRNEIAHEITRMLSEGLPRYWLDRFKSLLALITNIEQWWILNVELSTDPDYSGKDIKKENIIPGAIVSIQLMLNIALGSENEAKYYYEEFKRMN